MRVCLVGLSSDEIKYLNCSNSEISSTDPLQRSTATGISITSFRALPYPPFRVSPLGSSHTVQEGEEVSVFSVGEYSNLWAH